MAKWKSIVTTDKGHSIIAKSRAGIKIHYTKVVVGDGVHSEIIDGILSPKQISVIKEVKVIGENTVSVKSILSNRSLSIGYFIREIGIFAIAEDEPENEVLCAIAIADNDKADYWPEFEQTELRLPINMCLATGNASTVSVETINTFAAYEIGYDNEKSGLVATNVQAAIDEMILMHDLDVTIQHNLNAYPEVLVIESDFGYGMGYGVGPYGGTNGRKLRSCALYLNRNSIKISVEKQFNPVKTITPVNDREYIITFVESTLSLHVVLLVSNSTPSIPIDQSGKSYFYLTLY